MQENGSNKYDQFRIKRRAQFDKILYKGCLRIPHSSSFILLLSLILFLQEFEDMRSTLREQLEQTAIKLAELVNQTLRRCLHLICTFQSLGQE